MSVAMKAPPVELRVLGHTELSAAGHNTGSAVLRQPKRLALLAYLALAASDGFRRRDQIVALFWPEKDQLHARTQLRKVLYALRGVLGAEAFVTRGEQEVRLNKDALWCDAVAFRKACEARDWNGALALYRGDLLEGLFVSGAGSEFQTWLDEQRARLRDEASRAAWECSALADLGGNRDTAIAFAKRAFELNPHDEESVRRLIASLDRHADRAGALKVFGEWQEHLKAEFGAEPAPETRRLARTVQAERKGESLETPQSVRPRAPAATAASHQVSGSFPVEAAAASTPAPVAPAAATRTMPSGRTMMLAGLAVVAMFLVAFMTMQRSGSGVAVLPFRGSSASGDSALGESLAEELATALAQEPGLGVRSTARTAEVLRATADEDIGRSLGVAHFVEGSVVRDSNQVRVRLRLVRTSDNRTVWARSLIVKPFDVMRAHDSVATIAVRELRPNVR